MVFEVTVVNILEIDNYLKKHFSLMFKYGSEYYSLKRYKSRFCPKYSFIATDEPPVERKSLEELCAQVYVGKNIPLSEVVIHIEIPDWNNPDWESYEAIRHIAVVYRDEIYFSYQEKTYWIAYSVDGTAHLSDDDGRTQTFSSCRDLFANAQIGGKSLAEIWKNVVVDSY